MVDLHIESKDSVTGNKALSSQIPPPTRKVLFYSLGIYDHTAWGLRTVYAICFCFFIKSLRPFLLSIFLTFLHSRMFLIFNLGINISVYRATCKMCLILNTWPMYVELYMYMLQEGCPLYIYTSMTFLDYFLVCTLREIHVF